MTGIIGFFATLDMRTMVLGAAILYLALTVVMVHTYRFRKTYPGFGYFTLGQICWSLGIFSNFYQFLGDKLSLAVGNLLLLMYAVFWYYGIALYGDIGDIKKRNAINVAALIVTGGMLLYYIYIDFNTCRRVVYFSAFTAFVYARTALEPYCHKRWKTYPLQAVFSVTLLFVAALYLVRFAATLDKTECLPGGADSLTKLMLVIGMFIIPVLTYSLLSMTSGRVEAELRAAQEKLRHQAETDGLTGLPNRRHFLEEAQAALAAARERGGGVSLVMLDLDHFKAVNDTHGHQAGDAVLRAVAGCLREALRGPDRVGRLGGEEFGVLLPDCDLDAASRVASRLRRAVAGLGPAGRGVTASLGVAAGNEDVDNLLARADACLYAAKAAGRDRVCRQEARTGRPVAIVDEEG